MIGRGGPIARMRSVNERGLPCDLEPGIPPGANVTSVRNAPELYGKGLIDAIQDDVITAGAVSKADGVQGRVHWVKGVNGKERVGRFGWKADTATLKQFIADAFRNELGITSPLAPEDIPPANQSHHHRCFGEGAEIEDVGAQSKQSPHLWLRCLHRVRRFHLLAERHSLANSAAMSVILQVFRCERSACGSIRTC
jgi:hypothetical protein